MRSLIITVAGCSTRFSRSLGREQLKCVYYEKDPLKSLLAYWVRAGRYFDSIIIVGGYKFSDIKSYIRENRIQSSVPVSLIMNEHFEDYGSGYSLYLGLKEAIRQGCDNVVFAEGDLWIPDADFRKIISCENDVITTTYEDIDSRKSVVLYTTPDGHVHYLYDLQHDQLEIREPFRAVFNSGQIWKFADMGRMKGIIDSLSQADYSKTNLVIVQSYFGNMEINDISVIKITKWFNCNTVDDYRGIEFED